MSIQIEHVDDDPARDGDTITYRIKLKNGATQNEMTYFNEVAAKQTNKQFNSINGTSQQINVQVTGVTFTDMITKVQGLVDQVNAPENALKNEIRSYNEKIKQKT